MTIGQDFKDFGNDIVKGAKDLLNDIAKSPEQYNTTAAGYRVSGAKVNRAENQFASNVHKVATDVKTTTEEIYDGIKECIYDAEKKGVYCPQMYLSKNTCPFGYLCSPFQQSVFKTMATTATGFVTSTAVMMLAPEFFNPVTANAVTGPLNNLINSKLLKAEPAMDLLTHPRCYKVCQQDSDCMSGKCLKLATGGNVCKAPETIYSLTDLAS